MKESSWLNKPRDGFTKDRQQYFAQAPDVAPNGRPRKRAYPSTIDAVELQGKGNPSRGNQASVSHRAMKQTQKLIG